MLASEGELSIRKMLYSDVDFSWLYKWLNDEIVLSYYEGPTNKFTHEQIVEKYGQRAKGEDYVTPCIIELRNVPIGYLQFYQLQADEILAYGAKSDQSQYGLDIFIGETEFWNKGIGTAALKVIVEYIFTNRGVTGIYICPQTSNIRAIKSYEKCGFKKVRVLPEHELFEGVHRDNQLMVMERVLSL